MKEQAPHDARATGLARAKRTAWIAGAVALGIYVLAIVKMVLSK